MLTLIRKELKSLFCNPITLFVISVLSLIPVIALAVFLKISQSQMAYAGFENIVSLMALAFAVAIPAASIISNFKDKKAGTDEFVYSMPVSKGMLILSRLLSQIIFFAIPTAIMAVFPVIYKGFGTVNLLHLYFALGLLFVFEIFIISLSVMISEKSGKVLTSIIIAYVVLALSFVLGILSSIVRFLPFGTGFDKIFTNILLELSVFKKVDTAVYELLDWTAIAFFACGAIIFTVIAIVKVKRKLATVLVSIVLVACVGVLPMLLPLSARQIDANKNKLFTPSDSVVDYLSNIDEEITVYLIDPYANDQELYNAIIRMIESSKKIKLEIINSSENEDFLKSYGLQNHSRELLSYGMIVQGEKRWSFIGGQDYFSYYNKTMGYLTASELEYRYTYCATLLNQYYAHYDKLSANMQKTLQKCAMILQSLEKETLECLELENAFVDAVAYVTADMIPTVYFLSGHGEEGTSANPYDFKANGKLPDNADVAVINSPSEDYSDSEIDFLMNYVDNGGKLYVLIDVDNYSMPNLMRLLAHYGLTVDANVISADNKTAVPVSVNKSHEAFSDMTASEVTVKNVSRINCAEGTKYTYSPMLSYKHKESEEATETEYPVAISVSEGEEKRITLFTGATTFNSENNDISEEELERVAPCVTSVMNWMFDAFESDVKHNPPKLYQKSLYLADDGQITKIVVAFSAVIVALVISVLAYTLSRSMRSKRAAKFDEYTE